MKCYCLISEAAGRRKEKHTRFFFNFSAREVKNGNEICRFKGTEHILVNNLNLKSEKIERKRKFKRQSRKYSVGKLKEVSDRCD